MYYLVTLELSYNVLQALYDAVEAVSHQRVENMMNQAGGVNSIVRDPSNDLGATHLTPLGDNLKYAQHAHPSAPNCAPSGPRSL